MACRYLGVWGTPAGDMSATKARIFKKTEEARDLLRHHPLTPEQAIDLLTSVGVGAFRYSAALVPWTEKELERLEAVWIQAYKWAWGLPKTKASDVFTPPAGMEYLRDGAGTGSVAHWRYTARSNASSFTTRSHTDIRMEACCRRSQRRVAPGFGDSIARIA